MSSDHWNSSGSDRFSVAAVGHHLRPCRPPSGLASGEATPAAQRCCRHTPNIFRLR